MTTTKKFENLEMTEALRKLEPVLLAETVARIEYELLYQSYAEAKTWALKQLSGIGREVTSFPMYDDMCNILWTVAEFTSDVGELIEFRREGYTRIEVTIYKPDSDGRKK